MRTLERRLELLKLEGVGFSTGEIVKQLSVKYQCSERTVFNDMSSRGVWQPQVQQFRDADKLLLKIMNRLEQIYRKASLKHLKSLNDSVQLGALKIMLDATLKVVDVHVLLDVENRLRRLEEVAGHE